MRQVVFHEPAGIDEADRKNLLSSVIQARDFLLGSETYGWLHRTVESYFDC